MESSSPIELTRGKLGLGSLQPSKLDLFADIRPWVRGNFLAPSNRAPTFERAVFWHAPRISKIDNVSNLSTQSRKEKSSEAAGFRVERSVNTETKTPAQSTPSRTRPASTDRARSAPPLPKRNKGQLFLAVMFLAFFAGVFYSIYATFFQYKAYGIISGRLIKVSAPWDGTVTHWKVRDGDIVKQGDILAVISNIEMEHRLEKLDDELRYAQAEVEAEASKIRFTYSDKSDRDQKALAEYLEAQGNLLSERSVLDELERRLTRSKKLLKARNISQQAFDELYYRCAGQRQKMEKLEKAVEVLQARSANTSSDLNLRKRQLDPLIVKIDQIQLERERLRARVDLGRICAPVSGRVTLRTLFTGESIRQGDSLIEILEDNSAEAILYVPQGFTDQFQVGSQVMLTLEPFEQQVPCKVLRIHNQFKPAPSSISRFYQQNQHLLPVHLAPLPEFRNEFAARINGTVKLPYSWNEWVGDMWQSVKESFQTENSQSVDEPHQIPISNVTDEQIAEKVIDDQEIVLHESEPTGVIE